MTDKAILNSLFKDARVKRSALLAECVCTVERYLDITEEKLKSIRWVDKKGQYEQMLNNQEINSLITHRELYIKDVEKDEESSEKIESAAIFLSHRPVINTVLKYLVPSQKVSTIARQILKIESIDVCSDEFIKNLEKLTSEEHKGVVEFFSQRNDWSYEVLDRLPSKIETFAESLLLRSEFQGEDVSILSDELYSSLKHYLLRNWFKLQTNPELLLTDPKASSFRQKGDDEKLLRLAAELLRLEARNLDLLLLFLNEIVRLRSDLPSLAKEAIVTGNPFLFRSLFLNFKEAEEFAVGGKLNSSLETKYGNLFEKLMYGFGNCRGIYNGGVDVAIGTKAFDIKSGPNVMNKAMVDSFSAKQHLIQDAKLLPDLDTYKVALGYGKRDKLNSFMAKIESEILDGREAWTEITGIDYSPEIIFAIGALVPRIFGVESLVGSMLGKSEKYQKNDSDVFAFQELFTNNFPPISLTSAAEKEISSINSLLA